MLFSLYERYLRYRLGFKYLFKRYDGLHIFSLVYELRMIRRTRIKLRRGTIIEIIDRPSYIRPNMGALIIRLIA